MSRARVTFVRVPNFQKSGDWKKQGVIRCPLNIAMLASYIRTHGRFECSIADFEIIPGENPSRMADIILAENPKYVCFTTLSPRFPTVVRIARELRRKRPDIITVIGGPHVTGAPQVSLDDAVSYGIIGEGEEVLLELLGLLEQGRDPSRIANLVFRADGRTIVNPMRPFIRDIDALPFPAWDLMRIQEYLDPAYFDGPHLALFSSRGCPHDCAFCASGVTWKRRLRVRSVENVIAELQQITGKYGIHNVMFWDDNFAARKDRALALCETIKARDLRIKYTVQIRADQVSEELLVALKESGCAFAAIGVESGNESMLAGVGKNETKDQFRRAIALMKKIGVPSIASYIIGLPGDTHETIRETIDFAFELNADQSKFMILAPYPGTAVYKMAVEKGLVRPDDFAQLEALNYYDSVAINLSKVSDADLIRYQDEAYARFDALRQGSERQAEKLRLLGV